MTDTNERLRALFLSALMVLSVFAGTIALTGSAAAVPIGETDATDTLSSNDVFFQGEELYINVSGTPYENETSLTIEQVTDLSDGDTTFASDVSISDTGHAVIDTENLDGRYVLTNGSDYISVTNGKTTGNDTLQNSYFTVSVQDLSASFDEDDLPIQTGDTATIEVDSTRGNYFVNISAQGLDEGDLAEIFNQPGDQRDAVVDDSLNDEDDDDSIQIEAGTSTDIEANFTEYDEAGSYTFDLEVNDTTASASASVDVAEEDVSLEFSTGVYPNQVGDVSEVTVDMADTSEAWVYVGGTDVNYLERIHVEDDDDDGQVTIELNTFRMGWNESDGIDGNGRDYDGNGANDTGLSVAGDDVLGDDGVTRYTTSDVEGANASEGDLDDPISGNLGEPIEPGDYDLTVSSSDDAPYVNDDDELVIPDEEDIATLDLTERSTNGIQVGAAPGDTEIDNLDVDDGELQEVINQTTMKDTVAEGDVMVVQVDASGIFGYLAANDDQLTDTQVNTLLNDNEMAPLSLFVETSDAGPNQADASLNLDSSNSAIYTDQASNHLYLLVDSANVGNFDEDSYTATFRVGEDDEDSGPNSTASDPYENPYLDSDQEEIVESDFSIEDADAEFDNVVDDELQVAQSTEATVSGTTNLAPGSEVTVRLRRTGESPFLVTQSVDVQDDGSFSASFDTSEIPMDTAFTATVRDDTETISDEVDGMIVEQVETTTPGTTTPGTTTPGTTTAPPTTETTTSPPDTTEPPATETPGGQPGFGVAIAIVALLGAALLALRRRD